ncbi:hypothetical protein FBEOM_1494 [Fusarium beomiforme]|uniref:Uncharacterized protein n=1 Tax=Fusarium beomiforme TaxID=44412 RepID=A0A9P5AVG7_9HYPO|nr:hypothetical protein FBEOM_1494 [Fusarium beomiforme]
MAHFASLTVTTLAHIGNWQAALLEVQSQYPAIRPDAPEREPTLLPPPLPVKQQMDQFGGWNRKIKSNLTNLERLVTNHEERMSGMVMRALFGMLQATTNKIQQKIWDIDPQRLQREMNDIFGQMDRNYDALDDIQQRMQDAFEAREQDNNPDFDPVYFRHLHRMWQELDEMGDRIDQTDQELHALAQHLHPGFASEAGAEHENQEGNEGDDGEEN